MKTFAYATLHLLAGVVILLAGLFFSCAVIRLLLDIIPLWIPLAAISVIIFIVSCELLFEIHH